MKATMLLVALFLTAAACSASDTEQADEPTTTTEEAPPTSDAEPTTTEAALPTSACDQTFAAAAVVSDLQDTLDDLHPAVLACSSTEDWVAASDAHPDAIDGADPTVVLGNICLYAEDPEVGTSRLCEEQDG